MAYTDGCHSLTVLSLEPEAMVPFTPSNATDMTAAYMHQTFPEHEMHDQAIIVSGGQS